MLVKMRVGALRQISSRVLHWAQTSPKPLRGGRRDATAVGDQPMGMHEGRIEREEI